MSNEHVEMLNKFQPFDPDYKEIYFESASRSLHIDTKALQSLKDAVSRAETRMVILTGDAGHGKTHLCGLLLTELAQISMSEAAGRLDNDSYGENDLGKCSDDRQLRVIRDLSEKTDVAGGLRLSDARKAKDLVTVVCGNEGRLRACARAAGLEDVVSLIDSSVNEGHMRSPDSEVVLINLNHQSVATQDDSASIFQQVIDLWVSDDSKWESCLDCENRDLCPILDNRERLNEKSGSERFRSLAIESMLLIAERTGSTVTIRQLLIYAAHLLTAGLTCDDVERKVSENGGERSHHWQWEYLFHQVAFGDRLSEAQRAKLDVFSGIRKLDPGRRAIRAVDDRIDDSDDAFSQTFPPPYKAAETGKGAPTTKAKMKEQAQKHQRRWRAIRRFDFFEALSPASGEAVRPSARVGLNHIDDFQQILDPSTKKKEVNRIRNTLIRGLEAIQGIYRADKNVGELHISHWAFIARNTGTSVVGDSIDRSMIQLMSQSAAWERRNIHQHELINENVDWVDRCVVASFDGETASPERSLELMLHEFEFVMAAASGLRSEHFYAAQFRRITNSLARMVEVDEPNNEKVTIFSEDRKFTYRIEEGTFERVGPS